MHYLLGEEHDFLGCVVLAVEWDAPPWLHMNQRRTFAPMCCCIRAIALQGWLRQKYLFLTRPQEGRPKHATTRRRNAVQLSLEHSSINYVFYKDDKF